MLQVSEVTKIYGEQKAVDKVSLRVDPGEIVGIIGPNGAGKTTLIKMICGLLTPDTGSITINGKNVLDGPSVRKEMGYVPEDSPVYDDMGVMDYLLFFASLYEVPKKLAKERIKHLLSTLQFEYPDRELGNLSKGMKRKIMIARSLLQDPALVIYDEPASGLDPVTTNTIIEYIQSLRAQNKAILFTGHNLFQIEKICDRVVLLKDGMVHIDGPVHKIKEVIFQERFEIIALIGKTEKKILVEGKDLNDTLASLVAKRSKILHVNATGGTLEEAFLKIVRNK